MNEQLLGTRPVFGRRPALVVIDMTLGFTDPESPLACDLEGPISGIQELLNSSENEEGPQEHRNEFGTAGHYQKKISMFRRLSVNSRFGAQFRSVSDQ